MTKRVQTKNERARRLKSAMRAALLLVGVAAAGASFAQATTCATNEVTQTTFTPANFPWTDNTAPYNYTANVGTGAGAVTVNGSISTGQVNTGWPQNATFGNMTTFGFEVNRGNNTQTNTITFTFSKPVNHLRLFTNDLDRFNDGNGEYADQVTVTGTGPAGAVTPVGSDNGALVVTLANNARPSQSQADNGTNCGANDNGCNAQFDFAAPITTLTIVYSNYTTIASGDPPSQAIGVAFGGFCVQNPNPGIAKTAPASAVVGSAFNFALAVNNPGSAAAPSGVVVNDTINANNYTINSITPASGWTCTPNTGFPINSGNTPIACTSTGTIAAGATNVSVVTINVTPKSSAMPGPIANTATIPSGSGGDIDNTNNSSSTSTTLSQPLADLTVTKTNGVGTVVSGATTTYTITVANAGPTAANGAVVRDTSSGLNSCSVTSCTPSGSATCPVAGNFPNLFTTAGVAVPTLPNGGQVVFTVQCTAN